MTTSYSSNSQNTASTSASGSPPPPLPPPLQMPPRVMGAGACFSPGKSAQFAGQGSANLFMSKFNGSGNTNSLRMSQRNYQMPSSFNNIPALGGNLANNVNVVPQQMDVNYDL
jgi:hypothetical protein